MSAALKKSPTNCDGLAGGGKFIIIFDVFSHECMLVFKVCVAKKICPRDFNVILAINQFCAQNHVSNVVDVLPGVLSKKEKNPPASPSSRARQSQTPRCGTGRRVPLCHKATSNNFMSVRLGSNNNFYLAVC